MAEMTLILARSLSRYEFALPENNTPPRPYEALVTLRPANGMPLRVKPLRRTLFIKGTPQHQIIDRCLRLRREIFVEKLKWPLKVDDQGREIDQFDHKETGYFAVLRRGRVAATARILPAEKPSLLYDVFPHLITDETAQSPRPDIWEGARMALDPDLSASESRAICARLLADAIKEAMKRGRTNIYTVSDPVMERILLRSGANPSRLGPVIVDEFGIPALALKIECTASNYNSCNHIAERELEELTQIKVKMRNT